MAATDYDFAATRDGIIAAALRKVGALSLGQPVDGDDQVAAIEALNLLVKSWQNENIFLWTEQVVPITMAAGTASYSTGTNPPLINLYSGRLVDAQAQAYPLEIIRWDSYQEIVDKTRTGQPTQASFNPAGGGTVYLYPVPDTATAAWTLQFVGIAALKDLESSSSAGDFPVRWHRALIYALAADLAPEYGVTGNDLTSLENKAAFLFLKAKAADKDGEDDSFVKGAY